jgi:maltose/moltooligosaccharide transporter
MNQKPLPSVQKRMGFWQIWNMSFGFLGIQFGFALQNANTSRIFQTLGASESELPILWLAAPVTGLLVQPIIGYYSDRTWHPVWGRRRPYFAIGAILASMALIIMPNVPSLWMAAGMLWIMDASINVSMEPFRAFVGDLLPEDQRTKGFAMQSFFIGIGAVIASALPWVFTNVFGMNNTPGDGSVPQTVKWSYYVGAAAFFSAVMYTVFTTREYPPNPEEEEQINIKTMPIVIRYTPSVYATIGVILLLACLASVWLFWYLHWEKELLVLSGILGLFGLAYVLASIYMSKGIYRIGFVQMVRDFQNMPNTMVRLALVQFFSWFALFSMWIYATPAITSHVYNTTDTASRLYNDGADMVTILFSIYNGVAAVFAFALPVIARKIGKEKTHMLCLFAGGVALLSVYIIRQPSMLWWPMVGVGMAWASILSMPYAMLSNAIPSHKMGYYMGIFNFFIVIPQIVAASILGFLLRHFFQNQSIYALIIGGGAMILAGCCSLWVRQSPSHQTVTDVNNQ